MIRKPKRAKKRKNPNTSNSGASNLINTIITPKNTINPQIEELPFFVFFFFEPWEGFWTFRFALAILWELIWIETKKASQFEKLYYLEESIIFLQAKKQHFFFL